ncbi:hypothetical protein E1A91_D01G259200v1 [Gossypium mustelinum]|uniref:Metallothionein n=1 Tax=Gossypium mustelinum TaxID=34275 RepID=A0A5D2WBX3_GOSMU|nr:hypothetical protein E1A91_D01G259200v1 [Gossypium mustelinum]
MCPEMSCCRGNCGCGYGCKCRSGCCGYFDGAEMGTAAENGCKCGENCTCNPCKYK